MTKKRGKKPDSEPHDPGLRMRQERFCQEYVKDFNGTRAAIAAGYSPDSAKQIASENLTKPNLKARVDELIETQLAAASVTEERIIERLAEIAFGDTRKIAQFKKGSLTITDTEKLTRAQGGMIAEMSEKTGKQREKRIKFHDPLRAAELLGKTKKMFTDKVEYEGIANVQIVEDIPRTPRPGPGQPGAVSPDDIGKNNLTPPAAQAPAEQSQGDKPDSPPEPAHPASDSPPPST